MKKVDLDSLFEAISFPWHQMLSSTESHCGERFFKILQNELQTCYHPKKCVLFSQVEGIAPLINKCSVLYSSNLHPRNFLARTAVAEDWVWVFFTYRSEHCWPT